MDRQISLAEAFSMRPNRYRLLEKSIEKTGWNRDCTILETGCSVGDASVQLAERTEANVFAIDLAPDLIAEAQARHGTDGRLTFMCADARSLPFEDLIFNGIYTEAAFSPIQEKRKVLHEYSRILKPGGLIVVNDYVMKRDTDEDIRSEVVHIPCFAGVQTSECYDDMFIEAGFEKVYFREEYGELIGMTLWLCKVYGVEMKDIGGYLSQHFHFGASDGAACGLVRNDSSESFFKKSDLSYCQMIYRKGIGE